jgi:hypothetical protein
MMIVMSAHPGRRASILAVLLPILILAASPSTALADAPKCALCGRAIEGRILRVEGEVYHPGCFRCSYCGEPIEGAFSARDDRYYHPACAAEVGPKCAICGESLIGHEFFEDGGVRYCRRCYELEMADRCVVCGQGIVDASYPVNAWGQAWHAACAADLMECSVCCRAVGPRERGACRLPDGRVLCGRCAELGITDPAEGGRRLDTVAVELRRMGVEVSAAGVRLDLVDRPELIRRSGSSKVSGYTSIQTELTNGRVSREDVVISILTHLEPTRFDGVAAHELGHVFLHRKVTMDLPSRVEEGFCNYLSSLVLRRRDDPEAHYYLKTMDEDPDPDYGVGYRDVRGWVEDHSFARLLTDLERRTTLPQGL